MSWTAVTTTGRGELAFRLEIEGWPESWVTHSSMISLSTTPFRYGGLRVTGQKLKAIANPLTNELDVSGFSASVVDDQERATAAFRTWATARTWLTAELSASATTMSVRSTDGFASSGTLWIDSEAITYTGKTSTTFTGLTRGSLGSLAQKHYVDAIGRPRNPEVTNRPISMTGKRAKLYAYGQLDDPQGSGTQIWQGVVSRHPSAQGAEWKIPIDPITKVLERTVSGDLAEPATPRGIYYTPAQAFKISLLRRDTSGILTVRFPVASGDRAFFNNNADFCDYLTDRLSDEIEAEWAGNEIQVSAVADGETSWHLEVSSDGTVIEMWESPGGIDPVFGSLPVDEDGNEVGTDSLAWTADRVYRFLPTSESRPGAGSVPRGTYGTPSPAESIWPSTRIYLSGGVALSSLVDTVAIKWPGRDETRTPAITAIDATNNYIDLEAEAWGSGLTPSFPSIGFTAAELPEIRFGRTFANSGSAWTAISAIIAAAPDGLNAGSIPDVRSGDFDSTSWDDLDASTQPRIVRARVFKSFSESSLLDVVRQELTLAGYFLGITSTGTISIARVRPMISTTRGTAATVLAKDAAPTYEPDAYGHVSVLRLRRGFDPIEDDWSLPAVVVWDAGTLNRNPAARVLAIEPKSVPAGGIAETWAEAVETTARLFSVFAQPYARLQVDVPLTLWTSSVVGSIVTLTTDLVPDPRTGTRGVSALPCLVTGREIDLSRGRISLKLLTTVTAGAGYAPQSLISSETNVSGNTWDLTLTATNYFPSGDDASDWFVAGDEVIAAAWDSTSTTTIAGVVVSASGNVVRVTFDSSAAALTSDDWFLSYGPASTFVQSSQETFMFLADSDGQIDFDTAEPAKAFS